MPTILAIETSCDETAAAVLTDFSEVRAHEIFSQAEIHSEFGGVVPEVASRNHLAGAPRIIDRAMRGDELNALRARTLAPARGKVLEVGFGIRGERRGEREIVLRRAR